MKLIKNNGGTRRDISLNGWERAMVRGMIRDVKKNYFVSKNELAWLEAMDAKFQEVDAFEEGNIAGQAAQTAGEIQRCPYTVGSDDFCLWTNGFARGWNGGDSLDELRAIADARDLADD
jgi:hypothetical protein